MQEAVMRKSQRQKPVTDPRSPAASDPHDDSIAAGSSPARDIAIDSVDNTVRDGPYRIEGPFTGNEGEMIEVVSDIDEYQDNEPNDQVPGEAESPVPGDEEWLEGAVDLPLTSLYEQIAVRDELAERFESLVADVHEWLLDTNDPDAQSIYDDLVDLAERIGRPLPDTDTDDPVSG
jgi:hypothetical protein